MSDSDQIRGTGTLSKKRYQQIEEEFAKIVESAEQQAQLLSVIRTVLRFDPNVSNYTIYKERIPENETTYQKRNKDYYERHKEEIKRRNRERRQQTRTPTIIST